jgi:hypothetical protein
MLRAVLLIGITWTTLSFLFCLAWGRALLALSDTGAVGGGTLDYDARAPNGASMPNVVIVGARVCVGRIPCRRGQR